MRNHIRIIALTLALLCCAAAQRTALAQDASSISGAVMDAISHKPVPGAKIELFVDAPSPKGDYAFKMALSHKDGSFHLSGVPAGQYRVEVMKMGYEVQALTGLAVQEHEHLIVGEPIGMVAASSEYAEKMACNTLLRPDQVADVYVVCAGR